MDTWELTVSGKALFPISSSPSSKIRLENTITLQQFNLI